MSQSVSMGYACALDHTSEAARGAFLIRVRSGSVFKFELGGHFLNETGLWDEEETLLRKEHLAIP